jgi:6,7-dimethyl-8-ribityllumazine synthase
MAGPRRGKREKSDGKGARILIVEARFYDDIADALLTGARKALQQAKAQIDCLSVPGALEIPTAIAIALEAAARRRKPYDGAVALGCVIRGDTIHFEIVSQQSARGLMELSVARQVPIGNGILTVDTEAQAWIRASVEKQDKGGDAARAALALVVLKRRLGNTPERKR